MAISSTNATTMPIMRPKLLESSSGLSVVNAAKFYNITIVINFFFQNLKNRYFETVNFKLKTNNYEQVQISVVY